MNDDVLIVGSLKDDELRKSIDNLVDYVGTQTQVMAGKFEGAMDIMKSAMKDFAVTQNVSVNLMKQAWREMSSSFDAMVAAQTAATSSSSASGAKPTYADNTIGALEQEIALHEQARKQTLLESDALREQNHIIEEKKRLLNEQKGLNTDQELIKKASKDLGDAMSKSSSTLDLAKQKLAALEQVQSNYANGIGLSVKQQNRLTDAIERTKQKIDKLQATKPLTLVDAKMLPERSIDELSTKMKALRNVQTANAHEAKILGDEYQRLKRRQAELLGMNIQHTKSNNYLAQSFGYIRNRIVYALTLGAITSFTKQLYEIRGQYELLERSLGILINDMRRGSELFQELNEMALKSPFTLMELATGAKQLLAYNFAEEEVVDTTRRLADISAALGVPMERLVYNLGQIRAQTVLTARDARDFANAGLAIVPMLAKMYTEEKRFGDEIVTTSKVFDMMSDKMVSYGDVMKVINSVTDEGGKFFDFQAKQADTLRVKIANLTLSWNNMLNDIASANQGLMTLPLNALKLLFENWRSVYEIVKDVIVLYGVYRASAMLVAMANSTIISQQFISGMFNLGRAVHFVVGAWRALSVAVAANPLGAMAIVVTSVATAFGLFNNELGQAVEYQNKFGDAGAKTVADLETYFTTLSNISKESSNYTKVIGELNSILGEYNMELVSETDNQEQLNEKRRVSIQLIKEEILERKHLNEIEQGRKEYEAKVDSVRQKLRANLSDAITENFLGIGTVNDEIAKNAPAIANIIADVIENNIDAIADKTGDEYQKGVDKIFKEINTKMKAIGISEETRNKAWLENSPFRAFVDSNIIGNAINNMVAAKRELDSYNESLNKAYETEKKAAEDGAGFNDRVEQTQRRLMAAANDTDAFAKKVQMLLKEYGGQNVIDFLVKVQTQVPAWMSQKGLTELTQLSARFTALATNAKKSGKTSLNVNGKEFSVDQLFQRAAEYTQAAQNKAADIESRKSSKLTSEASNALREYKTAIEAVNIAKNKLKQNTADQALVTEKETEAQKKYNEALKKGVSVKELEEAKNGKRKSGSKKDPLGDALAKEIQLITDIQKLYKEYQKAGVDADSARIASAKEYEKTLKTTNTQLSKYGIKGLTGEQLATMDLRELRDYYQSMLDIASKLNNAKGVEALEKALRGVNSEIVKVDYKKITDGLNNELGKLKDEYELAVELDANPELGNMFADFMGINVDELPKTFRDVANKAQKYIDDVFKNARRKDTIDISSMLDKESFDKWVKESGLEIDSDLVKQVESFRQYLHKVQVDENKKITNEWANIVNKYGDLQSKVLAIYKNTVQEQVNLIRKFGDSGEIKEALDLSRQISLSDDPAVIASLQERLASIIKSVVDRNPQAKGIATSIDEKSKSETAKANWDAFKNSDLYAMTFEDMANNSTRAIQLIIDKLNDLKGTVSEDPASMKALMKALEDAESELNSRDPFGGIARSLNAMKQASIETAEAQRELWRAEVDVEQAQQKVEESKGGTPEQQKAAQDELADAIQRRATAQVNLTKAENNGKKGTENIRKSLQGMANQLQDVSGLFGSVSQIFKMAGDEDTSEAIDAINEGFTTMVTIIMAVDAAIKIVSTTNPYLLAIAAALSVIVGLVSFLSGNENKKIDAKIKDSELAVKRLENTYKNLEFAIENAYGANVIGAKQAAIANKELQLAELKRQLALEKSRDSKYRDEEKIIQLEGQIVDLQNDIKRSSQEIATELLGISSVGDAALSFMDAYISALRKGEDAQSAFTGSWKEMIANMIKQLWVTKVIGPQLEALVDEMNERLKSRSKVEAKAYANAVNELTRRQTMSDDDIRRELIQGEYNRWRDEELFPNGGWNTVLMAEKWRQLWNSVTQEQIDAYREDAEKNVKNAQRDLNKVTTPTIEDLSLVADAGESLIPMLEASNGAINAMLERFGLLDDTESNLSALQQGLQGVSEETASAVEAYLNGMSQQAYLRNDLLTQIRDTIMSFDMDVQMATQAQMLLQLQQSYTVQMAIQGILEGWNNPSGQAVRVELVS